MDACFPRWGGVSIPLTVSNRFEIDDKSETPFVFQRHLNGDASFDLEAVLTDNGLEPVSQATKSKSGYFYLLPRSGNVKLITLIGTSADNIHAVQADINANIN